MAEENVLQLVINSENLPIIVDSDLEKWSFNSYSHGYHEYVHEYLSPDDWRWITDLFKRKRNVYDPHDVAII